MMFALNLSSCKACGGIYAIWGMHIVKGEYFCEKCYEKLPKTTNFSNKIPKPIKYNKEETS
jgi:recombinational DNA repair protein (RecF pathway)